MAFSPPVSREITFLRRREIMTARSIEGVRSSLGPYRAGGSVPQVLADPRSGREKEYEPHPLPSSRECIAARLQALTSEAGFSAIPHGDQIQTASPG